MHITMNEFAAKDEKELRRVIRLLQEFERTTFRELVPTAKAVPLRVGGIGHFNNRVLFVQCSGACGDKGQGGDALPTLFNALQARLTTAKFSPKSRATDFQPHITICKAGGGKGKGKLKGKPTSSGLPPAVFEVADRNPTLGTQYLSELVFCVKRLPEEVTPPVVWRIRASAV